MLFVGSAASKDANASEIPKFFEVVEVVLLLTVDCSAPPKGAGALSEVLPKLDSLFTKRSLSALAFSFDLAIDPRA